MLEKDFSRSLRRFHTARLKKTRKAYWGHAKPYGDPMNAAQLGKVTQYPAVCSCPMCGNDRKHFNKRTIQELRHFDIAKIRDEDVD
jgi:rubredoxin